MTHMKEEGVAYRCRAAAPCISYTYFLTQGGRLYRWGNNATGVPERFHYTASRGIISRDISPRSTSTGVKFRATDPPRMKDEPFVWRPHTGGASPWATPLEGERVWGEQGRKLQQPTTLGQGIAPATENGRWPRGDRKYEGAVLITLPVTTGYTISDSCLFSLEAIERAMRGELNNT